MQKLRNFSNLWLYGLLGAVTAAVLLKLSLHKFSVVPFNADEAIVALMARHILVGKLPVFFYGQAYMGSLDAFLVAVFYKLVGESVWAIRLVQILLYSLTILTTGFLAKRMSGSWKVGVIAAWFLAIPNVNMTLYTTVSLGGYGEMLLIGNLILLITFRITQEIDQRNQSKVLWPWFALGFLSGIGLWAFGLTLVYSVAALVYLAWYLYRSKKIIRSEEAPTSLLGKLRFSFRTWRRQSPLMYSSLLGILILGGLFGSAPWWAYARQAGLLTLLQELGGGAIAGVENTDLLAQTLRHIINLSLFGTTVTFGLRPPWEIRWVALPLVPMLIFFWIAVIVYAVKKTLVEKKTGPRGEDFSHAPLLMGILLILVIGFILTPFGADPSGRYFLPLGLVLSIFGAQVVRKSSSRLGPFAWMIVILILGAHFWGTFQVARRYPPGITTQFDQVTQIDHRFDEELIEFLRSEKEFRGYTNYWVAYPLAFNSDEEMIFVPKLPYHHDLRYTPRDNRYPPYNQLVDEAERVAYITTNNPDLDHQIRSGLYNLNVSWREIKIGDYQVYYQLSQRIPPEMLRIRGDEG